MDIRKLAALSFWTDWQKKVEDTIPLFAEDSVFCHQTMDQSRFHQTALRVSQQPVIFDRDGKERDVPYGAGPYMVDTKELGRVSRMWLDTNREINFLKTYLDLKSLNVLDIGAGYGRLAVVLANEVQHVSTVDSVDIAVSSCRYYCKKHNPKVNVMSLSDMLIAHKTDTLPKFDLAINIHSWSECDIHGVRAWVETLMELRVPYLFTVMHTHDYLAYNSCDSIKDLLLTYYAPFAHRSDGINDCPYDLWRARNL